VVRGGKALKDGIPVPSRMPHGLIAVARDGESLRLVSALLLRALMPAMGLRRRVASYIVVSLSYRLKADAIAIEHRALSRLADEYDAAQARGELSVQGQHKSHVPSENMRASNEDIGISRKTVFEARQIRDAEKADPGIVQRTLDEQIERGEEPTAGGRKMKPLAFQPERQKGV
jgi:hypothetical protein